MMIPFYKPWLAELEKEYATKAIESTWISSQGEYLDRFEEEFARSVGAKYAVACNNGTAACHLALLANGIGPGDEVIVPNYTFIATLNAVKYCGATPIIVDVNNLSWNIVLEESLISEKTKAIFAVHLMGNPCNYHRLKEIRDRYNIKIIEDAAEAFGASYLKEETESSLVGQTIYNKDRLSVGTPIFYNVVKTSKQKVGSWFDGAAFSLYGNKTLTTGEGGVFTTNDEELARLARLYRGQGQTEQYFHPVVGYNYRMTNVAAAIGCAQLERRSTILREKRRVYQRYEKNFSMLGGHQMVEKDHYHGHWAFAIKLRPEQKNKIVHDQKRFFDIRPMFRAMSDMPQYRNHYYGINPHNLDNVLMLPSYPELSNEDIDRISANITGF